MITMSDNYKKLGKRKFINNMYCPNKKCMGVGPMIDDGLDGPVFRARSFTCPECGSFIELKLDDITYDDVHCTVTTTGIAWIDGHTGAHPVHAVWSMLSDFVRLDVNYELTGF